MTGLPDLDPNGNSPASGVVLMPDHSNFDEWLQDVSNTLAEKLRKLR